VDSATLGKRLIELRKKKRLNQQDLSNLLGVSRDTYAQYEIGRRGTKRPDIGLIKKLADFHGVSIDYLLGDSDVKYPFVYDPSFEKEMDDFVDALIDYISKKPILPQNLSTTDKEFFKELMAILRGPNGLWDYSQMDHFTREKLIELLFPKIEIQQTKLIPKLTVPGFKGDFIVTEDELNKNIPDKQALSHVIWHPNKDNIIKLPLYGQSAAGQPIFNDSQIEDWYNADVDLLRIPRSNTNDYFYLRVKGNSMAPQINDGDIVLVQKQDTADNGQVVVVSCIDSGITIKRFHAKNGMIILSSDNPEYPPQMHSVKECRVIGIVKKQIGDIT
jgi:SOS-response transcriptional repressor LexA/DNA-binding XRE family transcriptional regulator